MTFLNIEKKKINSNSDNCSGLPCKSASVNGGKQTGAYCLTRTFLPPVTLFIILFA